MKFFLIRKAILHKSKRTYTLDNLIGLRLDLSFKFQKNLRGNKYKAVTTPLFQEGFDVLYLMSFRGEKYTSLLSQVLLKGL